MSAARASRPRAARLDLAGPNPELASLVRWTVAWDGEALIVAGDPAARHGVIA